jgi:prophage maintenance system killer protein
LNRPTVGLVVAINHVVRREDEWFDEPDELDRVSRALAAIDLIEHPVEAAAVLAYRVARAQAFAEGNKRTALLVARWVLDRNGLEGASFLPPDDREVAELLVKAASGLDVGAELVALLLSRSRRA